MMLLSGNRVAELRILWTSWGQVIATRRRMEEQVRQGTIEQRLIAMEDSIHGSGVNLPTGQTRQRGSVVQHVNFLEQAYQDTTERHDAIHERVAFLENQLQIYPDKATSPRPGGPRASIVEHVSYLEQALQDSADKHER